MGKSKGKRKRTESQDDGSRNPLSTFPSMDIPTFNLATSVESSLKDPNGTENPIGVGDEGGGEWQTVGPKRSSKKQKHANSNYPEIWPAKQHQLQGKIKINDLQSLVLYLLADGTAPNWVAVKHHTDIRRVVVVMVPGLERGMFDGDIALTNVKTNGNTSADQEQKAETQGGAETEELTAVDGSKANGESDTTTFGREKPTSPDSYLPSTLSEDALPEPLKPLAQIFKHIWPVLTPGDERFSRISSPIHSMLTSPLPKTKEEKKAKGIQPPLSAKNWVDKRTPVTEFIATLDELRENEYVIHPALLESSEEKSAEAERRRKAREWVDDGWVDTRVDNREDGEPDPKTIDAGSVTQGRDVLAIDCEMCKTVDGDLDLTRTSIVRWDGEVVLDELVKPEKAVIDYLTPYSGISKEMLDPVTTTLSDIQSRLLEILHPKAILLGHSLNADLAALRVTHPFIIDTSILYQHPRGPPLKCGLKFLTQKYLGRQIQQGHGSNGHDSIEDAKACLDLVKQKCEKGPKWGTSEAIGESIFKRLARSRRPAKHGAYAGSDNERLGAVVDWGQPEKSFGAFAKVCIGCKNDEEIVEGVRTAVHGDPLGKLVSGGGLDFVWARLRGLEALKGWWADNRNPMDAQLIADAAARAGAGEAASESCILGITAISTAEALAAAVKKTVKCITDIYESLPPCTAMIVYSGTGDPREMSRLQAMHQTYKKEYRTKKWDELSVKWTDIEEQALKRAVYTARNGVGFVVVK